MTASQPSSANLTNPTEDLDEGNMTFWEHLQELRVRLIRIVLGFLVGASVAWWFKEKLLVILTKPFVTGWGQVSARAADGAEKASNFVTPSLHFGDPAGLFVSYIKLAVLGGFVLSLPITLYQVWAFIAPGLYAKEKKFAIPFVFLSCVLFCVGAYFGWRVVFPLAFEYLLNYAELPLESQLEVKPTVMIESYLAFVTRALLAFGAVFEIPVVIFFLSAAGVINHMHLIRFARYFIVIAFMLSAIITPPDPLSQILLAGPLILLYTLSIGIAWLMSKSRRKSAAA